MNLSQIKQIINVEAFERIIRAIISSDIESWSSNPNLTVDDVISKIGGVETFLVEWFNNIRTGWNNLLWKSRNGYKILPASFIAELLYEKHFDENLFEEDFEETAFKQWEEKYVHGI